MNGWTIFFVLIIAFIGLTLYHQGVPKSSEDVTTVAKIEGKDFLGDTLDYLKDIVKKEDGSLVITINETNSTGGING